MKQGFVEAVFETEHGHKINPGDQVVVLTTCTGRLSARKAKYLGYIKYPDRKRVRIEWTQSNYRAVFKETGEPAKWPYNHADIEYKSVDTVVTSVLWDNRILPADAHISELCQLMNG